MVTPDIHRSYFRALPPLMCVAVLLAWAVGGGGYAPTEWYPGGLVIVALLAAVAVARMRQPSASPVLAAAMGLLAAYGLVNVLSIAWAEVQGDAWEGGNRALVYVAIFAIFALTPWSADIGTLVLGAAAVGFGAVGLLVVGSAASATDPESFFVSARLAEPTGYPNAAAALYFVPMFAAVVLASRRELPAWARALLLGTGGTLLGLGLLPQSRASVVSAAATVVVLLIVARERLRTLLAVALVAATATFFLPAFLAVDLYDAESSADVVDSLADARNALVIVFAVLALLGFAWSWVDRHKPLPAAMLVRLNRVAVFAAAALVAGVVLAAAVVAASGRLSEAWEDFRNSEPEVAGTSSHFAAPLAGGNRYDIWRVALLQFQESPLVGDGADNFEADYLRERRSIDEPQHPHGLPFRVLGQTGIIGAVFLLGFIGVAGFAAISRARRPATPAGAGVALAGLGAFTFWLVHGTVDWLWEFPAVSGFALASVALASAVNASHGRTLVAVRDRVVPAAVLAAAIAMAGSFLPPWLAERQVTRAGEIWREDPAAALEALERARELNPLSDRPDMLAGAIAGRTGRSERARAAFADALIRNPTSWYSRLELAVLAYEREDTRTALRQIALGRASNPRDQVMREVERLMREDERVTLQDLDGLFSRQLDRLQGERRE